MVVCGDRGAPEWLVYAGACCRYIVDTGEEELSLWGSCWHGGGVAIAEGTTSGACQELLLLEEREREWAKIDFRERATG